MSVLTQPFLALVRGHFMTLALFSAGHNYLVIMVLKSMIFGYTSMQEY